MFRNYLAAALRNLVRNRLYAGVMIVGLAVAFGSAILIGLYLRHELTYDRFIPDHERIYIVNQRFEMKDKPRMDIDFSSANLAAEIELEFPQIEETARLTTFGFPPTVRRGDVSASEQNFMWADPTFFRILRVPTVAGDLATALDAADALVITRSTARRYFQQDAPLGGRLMVDGHPMRVAAVIEDLPSNSHLKGDLFGSTHAAFSLMRSLDAAGYSSNSNITYVKLKPSVSKASMDEALMGFMDRRILPAQKTINPNATIYGQSIRLKPLTAIHTDPALGGDLKPGADIKVLLGLGIIGGLIVIVAAINFVTLMTARAARRATEVGVRKALGAERRDLVLQFMGEALIYVVVALVLAVALAELLLPAVNTALQRKIAFDYFSDPALAAVMLGVVLLTGLAAGVYPALVLSSFRPSTVLKGGPLSVGGGGTLVREALVVAQFAVLVTLLFSTTTIVRQTLFALKDATRTDKDGVVMLFASPCTDALRDAVATIRGVQRAACASPAAVELSHMNDMVQANGRHVFLSYAPVDFGFFEVYRVQPVAGRLFRRDRPADDGGRMREVAPTIVLNESAVRTVGFKSPEDALGKTIAWHFNPDMSMRNMDPKDPPYRTSEVIGVVPDISFGSVRSEVAPGFYYVGPKTDMMGSVALNIRLQPGAGRETLEAIDATWKRFSHGLPLQRYSANQFLMRLYMDNVIQGGFIAVCAIVAISIAALGLFALSAFTAERRTKEIGVRKAMGASSGDILKLLLWQFTRPVLLANLIAWPIGFLVMRWWLSSFAYHVDVALWTFAAAGVGALVIALATVFVHALNVARAKPVAALRYE